MLTTQELATKAGVSVARINKWRELGILEKGSAFSSGEKDGWFLIQEIKVVLELQQGGWSLDAIKEFFDNELLLFLVRIANRCDGMAAFTPSEKDELNRFYKILKRIPPEKIYATGLLRRLPDDLRINGSFLKWVHWKAIRILEQLCNRCEATRQVLSGIITETIGMPMFVDSDIHIGPEVERSLGDVERSLLAVENGTGTIIITLHHYLFPEIQ